MADEQSDDDGQLDGWGKMVYRWSDSDGWSVRQIAGLVGGVTEGQINDELTGCWMDWSYDGQTGMTDGLTVSQTDSATDRWVN